MVESDGNMNETYTDLKFHLCTSEEMHEFHHPNEASWTRMNALLDANVMYCLDATDTEGNVIDLNISGSNELVAHRRMQLNYLPCTPKLKGTNRGECEVNNFSRSSL
jgi:hypothetical protein